MNKLIYNIYLKFTNPQDHGQLRNWKFNFTVLALFLSSGATFWFIIALIFELYEASVIPGFYVLFTLVNLYFFAKTQNFTLHRTLQVIFSLILPFAFEWMLGGFVASGAVCIWSLLALIGLLTCTPLEWERLIFWFLVYAAFAGATLLLEYRYESFLPEVYVGNPEFLFFINISAVGGFLFFISQIFIRSEQAIKLKLHGQIKAINSTLATAEINTDGTIRSANELLCSILRCNNSLLKGKNINDIIQLEECQPCAWEKIAGKAQSIIGEFKLINKEGEERWLYANFTPVTNAFQQVQYVILLANDITEAKRAQEKIISLTEEQKLLSLVVQKVSNAVIITDKDGYTTWVNQGFTDLTGYTLEHIKGKKPGALLQGPDTDPEAVRKIREGLRIKAPFYAEILNYHRLGLPYWVNLQITPILDEKGEVSMFISVQSDITERKNAEERLKQAYEEIKANNELLEESAAILDQKNQQLQLQTEMLLKQSVELEEKNNKIQQSINYASRIQNAVLPSEEEFKTLLKDAFVLFRPKDIVSGDFYWYARKKDDNIQLDKIIIVAADCTGHGVPGAFMSLIGNSILNQIIHDKEIHRPDLILQEMHCQIEKLLRQRETGNRDGMDVTICTLDFANQKVEFAGANNSLYRISNFKFEVYKGDRFSVGNVIIQQAHRERNFTLHTFPLLKGDCYYMMSDGFEDQFGGEEDKKFGAKQMQSQLYQIHQMPMHLQKSIMEKVFVKWLGERKQTDDVLLLGFKI
ncbi:MAG: PAS domain S-box protein [Cytophagales bacterium]|nr:PAS domain S-box protein [Cytophagales bacterium]MDW8385160.1 PAS domain S-box protein [Flammeovirgaceae bacterium]